jgi:hypothetical protein
MTSHTVPSIADTVLMTIGHTPMVIVPGMTTRDGAPLMLKLEGNNPTGSIYDRAVLHSSLRGGGIHVHDNDALAASMSQLTTLIGVPTTYDSADGSVFAAMARALGAREAPARASDGFTLDIEGMLRGVLEEIATDLDSIVADHVTVVLPGATGLSGHFTTALLSQPPAPHKQVSSESWERLHPLSVLISPDDVARKALATTGLLVDAASAAATFWAATHVDGPGVVITLADGALNAVPGLPNMSCEGTGQ